MKNFITKCLIFQFAYKSIWVGSFFHQRNFDKTSICRIFRCYFFEPLNVCLKRNFINTLDGQTQIYLLTNLHIILYIGIVLRPFRFEGFVTIRSRVAKEKGQLNLTLQDFQSNSYPVFAKFVHIRTIFALINFASFEGNIGIGHIDTEKR